MNGNWSRPWDAMSERRNGHDGYSDNIYEHINGPTLVRCFILLYDTNMYFNLLPSMVK